MIDAALDMVVVVYAVIAWITYAATVVAMYLVPDYIKANKQVAAQLEPYVSQMLFRTRVTKYVMGVLMLAHTMSMVTLNPSAVVITGVAGLVVTYIPYFRQTIELVRDWIRLLSALERYNATR